MQCKKTGKKAHLELEDNVYVMNVMMYDGSQRRAGKIVVDSGAAENVMPKNWLENEEMLSKTPGIRLDGNPLGNYGRNIVKFEPMHTEQSSGFWRQS